MAELTVPLPLRNVGNLGVGQFRAVLWLRWRIFVNGSRRKGGKAELVFRLVLYPLAFCLFFGPALLAGFFAWALAMRNALGSLSLVFWGVFALTQLLNINLGQPGTTFDPTELIRFPVTLRSYVLVRLTFGLLSPANVVVTLASAAIFIGVTIDRPHLWPWTLFATLAFAAANVFFSRMIFAWVDRWLSTRRAREIFTAVIFASSLGVQYLNVTYNPGLNRGHHHRQVTSRNLRQAQIAFHNVQPWVGLLPPELASTAIRDAERGRGAASLVATSGIALYAAVFVAVYALRMRTEFRGENLSDQANAVARTRLPVALAPSQAALSSRSVTHGLPMRAGILPGALAPMLGKEFLLLRRNTGLLYGVIAPTVMVFLFAGRLSLRNDSHWLVPMGVAYALLGLAPMSYNSFGLEGPGAQLYFMAPVPLREVFLAKNLLHFLLAAFEVLVVLAIMANVGGRPHAADLLFASLWAAATLLFNVTLGNRRSLSAPKKVNPHRSMNRTQSQLSAWMAMGVLVGNAVVGAALLLLGTVLHLAWLPIAAVTALAGVALWFYMQGLRGIEVYALDHRESLMEELGKKT